MRAFVVDSCALALEADTHLLVSVDSSVQIDAAAEREHVLSRMLGPADIDLVLCVIRKDDFPDHALIETLSHWALGIPVAVLSIHDTIEEMLKVRRSGAAGFIPLSLRRGVIINAIRVLLAGGTYFPACRYLRRLNDGSSNIAHGTARSTLTSLTPRQSEILDFMSHGLTNKEIARRMGLSDGTIRAHVAGIFRTMGVRNRLQATKIYFEKSKARAQIPSSTP
jgi:DNA-binding NarL/FixJ family response regulator